MVKDINLTREEFLSGCLFGFNNDDLPFLRIGPNGRVQYMCAVDEWKNIGVKSIKALHERKKSNANKQ